MNVTSLAIGVAALGYGLYSIWLRRTRPEQFGKIDAMKKLWGERTGVAVHIIGYTILPIAFGLVMILDALRGK